MELLDIIPDIVQNIREFSGNREEFSPWRRSVERVLTLYEPICTTTRYQFILHVIRTKIVGEADTALECYRIPLDWEQMKQCLTMHYGDNRDFGTLEYQMTNLRQGSQTFNEFYQTIYNYLFLILDKLSCSKLDESSLTTMFNSYRQKALKTFIKGLNGDLPRLLTIKEPTSLPHALQLCNDLDNMSRKWKRYPEESSAAETKQLNCNQCNGINGIDQLNGMRLYTYFPEYNTTQMESTSTTSPQAMVEQFEKNFKIYTEFEITNKSAADDVMKIPSKIGFQESKVIALPYFQACVKGEMPNIFLLDTGRNYNFIKAKLVADPKLNDSAFSITSDGEEIQITEYTYINLFGNQYPPVKFFLLPNMDIFDGIIGFKTMQELSAVINTVESCLIIKGGKKIKLYQKVDKLKEYRRLQQLLQENSDNYNAHTIEVALPNDKPL